MIVLPCSLSLVHLCLSFPLPKHNLKVIRKLKQYVVGISLTEYLLTIHLTYICAWFKHYKSRG